MEKISIRNAQNAKTGLQDMIDYINQFINVSESNILEVGSYAGDSADIFAQNFEKVFCIDPWVNGYDDADNASHQHDMEIIEAQFNEHIMGVYDNVVKIKGTSQEIRMTFPAVILLDVIYIDGIHQYQSVKDDIKAWLPKIRKGGFLAGHDFQPRFQGTIDAVNEFKEPDRIFLDTSWVIRVC